MKLARSLLMTGAPVTAGLALATTVLAAGSAPPVTVRAEGATRTLLSTRTVAVPTSGSITKGGTPRGACPADSAAGALSAATHGHWNGTYYKGLGIEVTTILGRTLDPKRAYWEFFVNDRAASKGICETKLRRGESLLFAPVPSKGKAEAPIVVRAPKTVTAGKPFDVRAFVYTGKGNATKPLNRARAVWSWSAVRQGAGPKLTESRTRRRDEMRFTFSGASSAHLTLVVSAKGEIRSAPIAIKVVK